ncbi:hypothetical protein PUN28_016735 [Cardiocondyla obscurior]|uniref:Transmembrane protein n=1 Tax=Cardiocondyla obscurior TaxID=286306 RepID=A0AAW2ESR1_9HYME
MIEKTKEKVVEVLFLNSRWSSAVSVSRRINYEFRMRIDTHHVSHPMKNCSARALKNSKVLFPRPLHIGLQHFSLFLSLSLFLFHIFSYISIKVVSRIGALLLLCGTASPLCFLHLLSLVFLFVFLFFFFFSFKLFLSFRHSSFLSFFRTSTLFIIFL